MNHPYPTPPVPIDAAELARWNRANDRARRDYRTHAPASCTRCGGDTVAIERVCGRCREARS